MYKAAPTIHARTPVHSAAVTATWQLATLPSVPQVLPGDGDRAPTLFGKARPVENQHAAPLGNHRPQLPPHAFGTPRGMRDEMLKRLIGPRIGDALEHRAHRLAATVAEQPQQVPTKRPALRDMPEAHFERLEPRAQAVEPRRRIARQSRQHSRSSPRTTDITDAAPLRWGSVFCPLPTPPTHQDSSPRNPAPRADIFYRPRRTGSFVTTQPMNDV